MVEDSMAFLCRSLAVFHANVACQSCLMLPTPWVQMSTDAASKSISGAYTRTGSAMTVSLLLLSLSSLSVQLKKKTLEVTVWDYDRSSSNDFLGEVSVFRTFKLSHACLLYFILICLPWSFRALERKFKSLSLQSLCGCLARISAWFGVRCLCPLSLRYWSTCPTPPSSTTFLAGCLWGSRARASSTAKSTLLRARLDLGQVRVMGRATATCPVWGRGSVSDRVKHPAKGTGVRTHL